MQMKRCIKTSTPYRGKPPCQWGHCPNGSNADFQSRLAFPPLAHQCKPVFSKVLTSSSYSVKFVRLVSAIFSTTLAMKAADTNLPALNLIAAKRPLVIGHRGYCQFAPENTLPSFKLATAAGAELVELDYWPTKDGKLMVMHDGDLDRTTAATSRLAAQHIQVSTKT